MVVFDFLAKSRTYLDKTSDGVLKRRKIVLSFLNKKYKLTRGTVGKVVEAVKEAGSRNPTRANVMNDAAAYRTAYRYLTGDEKDRRKIEKQLSARMPNTTGLRALLKDGITTRDDLLALEREAPAPQGVPPEAKSAAAAAPPAEEFLLLRRSEITRLLQAFSDIRSRSKGLEAENSRLAGEAQKHEEELRALHERLTSIRETRFQELLKEFPELRDSVEKAEKKAAEEVAATIPPGLPTRVGARLGNLPISYSKSFVREFERLSGEEKAQVRKALQFLKAEGPHYHSLDTKKLEAGARGTPPGSFVSRAARHLRFTWFQNDQVHVLELFTRGDKGLYGTE